MRLAQPNFFTILLIVLAALAVFYAWVSKSRKMALERFAQKELLNELLDRIHPARQKLKTMMLIAAVLFGLLALLRPQWGFRWQEVKRRGLDILIALDTSKSMLAADVKPSRLERSKLAIRDLTGNLKGDRVGLIAFAGSAFLECPLTVDYGGFLLSLEALDANIIPRGGTSISSAIKEAIRSYEGGLNKYKVLIIITDGEEHEGDSLRAAEEAKKAGITIFCIGIGTKEGELISLSQEDGSWSYLKDRQGNVVKSRLNESVLERIALSTGGSYIRSTSMEFGLDLLYREKLSKMEKRDFESRLSKLYDERFQIPLGLALILILFEPFVTDRRSRLTQDPKQA
ncbi:MAG: VWA domain-containing protein [Candidatus Omnitrophota bacterium]